MYVTIPTTGSRGDVQPYVALGKGLQARGHQVRLATHADFEGFVRGHGLDFFPLAGAGRDLQASETGDRMLRTGSNPFTYLREFARLRQPLLHDLMDNCWRACQGTDVILLTTTELFIGMATAEKLGVPVCWSCLQPVTPSFFLANFLFPALPTWLPVGWLYNLATHALVGEMFWQFLRSSVNEARRAVLGLPPLSFLGPAGAYLFPPLCLDGYSQLVVPKPWDWSERHYLTGYWFLESAARWQPPREVVDFLADGPPPVCIGFGSMHNRDAEEVSRLVIRALELAGQRGVLLTGWGGLASVSSSDRIFVAEGLPHDWLFPRMAAVVHHGGAGATSAALRAGVPAVVVPFMSDQPFWARRVFALGAGPRPIPRRQLTAERLARGIRLAVNDAGIRRRAAVLGQRLRAEDGVSRAADLFDHHFAASGQSQRPALRSREAA